MKTSTRQFWIKIHRWLGLTALVFLFIAGVTGSFLCFDKRIDAALNADLFKHETPVQNVSTPALASELQALHPELVVTAFPLNLGPTENLRLDVAATPGSPELGFNQLFVNPANGVVVGTRHVEPGWGRRHIVEGIFQLHSTLVAGKWGRWIMGLAALGWLIGNLVGLYLTFPAKKPFWPKWKKKWKIDTSANIRRLMLEIHNSSGLWLLIPATILAYTSVAMNFFDEAFVPVVQAISPAKPSLFDAPPPPTAANPHATPLGFGRALQLASEQAAARRVAGKPAIERYDARYAVYGVSFTDNGVENYHRLGPVTLYLDAASGRLVDIDDPYHDSFGRKLARSLYPLHSGDIAGLIGIFVIFLLGASTAEMCVTGFYTWWKKRQSRSGKRSSPKAQRA